MVISDYQFSLRSINCPIAIYVTISTEFIGSAYKSLIYSQEFVGIRSEGIDIQGKATLYLKQNEIFFCIGCTDNHY